MNPDTDPTTSALATSAGEILAGAVFGAILAALLVILREGTPSANTEILGGAVLFGGLGVIRASRRSDSLRMLWNEARLQWHGTREELSVYVRAAMRTLRAADHWALQQFRRLAEMRSREARLPADGQVGSALDQDPHRLTAAPRSTTMAGCAPPGPPSSSWD